jgi:hypothetical protein
MPALRQDRRPLLRQLHLHRPRHAVPERQLFIHLYVQTVRWHGPALLLELHVHRPCVQGSGDSLRQQQQYLHGLRSYRRPLLRQQRLQRRKRGMQELSLCCMRNAWHDRFDGCSVLCGQHLQERVLCHALRRFDLRRSNLRGGWRWL